MNLVLPKIEKCSTESLSSVVDLRTDKHNPTGIETSDIGKGTLKSESTEDPDDPDKDPDWYPTPDLKDKSDEDGNAELLNELSIFEYMEKYQTIYSDSENDSDDELILSSKSSPKQDDNHLDTSERIHASTGKW